MIQEYRQKSAEKLGWYIRKGSKDTYWIDLDDKVNTRVNMGAVEDWQPDEKAYQMLNMLWGLFLKEEK